MDARTGSEQPSLRQPFHLRGYDGSVSVFYGITRDPRHTGFDLLNLPFDLALTKGYPTLHAAVEYGGPGYRAHMGWIQLITNRDPATGASIVSIDLMPIQENEDSPFVCYGSAPNLFDAPANPDHETEDWVADTFLVTCPDIGRTRRIAALLGFRWGYALRQRHAAPLPLEIPGAEAWDSHLLTLRGRFPSWEFLPGFATDL